MHTSTHTPTNFPLLSGLVHWIVTWSQLWVPEVGWTSACNKERKKESYVKFVCFHFRSAFQPQTAIPAVAELLFLPPLIKSHMYQFQYQCCVVVPCYGHFCVHCQIVFWYPTCPQRSRKSSWCIQTITFEPSDLWPRYLACWFTLTWSKSDSQVKVIGQSS